jgi:hypothetical protein
MFQSKKIIFVPLILLGVMSLLILLIQILLGENLSGPLFLNCFLLGVDTLYEQMSHVINLQLPWN